jgi:uroporphyrinogen-III decarboxylase
MTVWTTEPLLKTEDDIRRWMKWCPLPVKADLSAIAEARERVGDDGIVRTFPFSPGQGAPWQSFCTLMGTTEAIYLAYDEPDLVHEVLTHIVERTLKVAELCKGTRADMIELGGGAGSNTVISPAMFKEFCVPYDQKQNEAFHSLGLKTVYHLCGGLMQMLELVVENGADGLETMTPVSMGGDCDLREASRRVGDKLFFIGGFDQNQGFERGTPEVAKRLVHECFEATKDHAGYIIAPSDHFFEGDEENLRAFCEAVHECVY